MTAPARARRLDDGISVQVKSIETLLCVARPYRLPEDAVLFAISVTRTARGRPGGSGLKA